MSMEDAWHTLKDENERRRAVVLGAYGRLFADQARPGDAEIVLEDLRAFCHVDRDMFVPEAPTLTANLLGRYRVWQRIDGLRRGDRQGFDPQGYAPETAETRPRHRPVPGTTAGPLVSEG